MTLLLTQMAIILLITVTCGWLALKVGQARVIGELSAASSLDRPSLGASRRNLSASLFPQSSFGPFETLSTVGLVLFLFLIGMELDYEQLYRQRVTAIMASLMSILLPFAMAPAVPFPPDPLCAPRNWQHPFVLFLGIAMSITAFPYWPVFWRSAICRGPPWAPRDPLRGGDDVVAWSLLAFAWLYRWGGRSLLAAVPPHRAGHLLFSHAWCHSPLSGVRCAPV